MLIPFDLVLYTAWMGLMFVEGGSVAPPALGYAAFVTLAGSLAAALPVGVAVWLFGRFADGPARGSASAGGAVNTGGAAGAPDPERIGRAARASLYARAWIFLAAILVLRFGQLPAALLDAYPDNEAVELLAPVAGLLPFVGVFFAVWWAAHPFFVRAGAASRRRRAFLAHQARYNLYILAVMVPWMLLGGWLEGKGGFWLSTALFALGLFWTFPWVLARIWGCRLLPDGSSMAARVRELESRAGARFSRIYVWPLGDGRAVNAAAVGLVPPFRYLFLSRGLLERLDDEAVDGVVAHELGHIRHRHQASLLAGGVACLTALMALVDQLPLESTAERALAALLALAFFFRVAMGFMMRRFERQADLFALRLTGGSEPLARALERVAELSGQRRDAPNWHHHGIGERVGFLRAAAAHPSLAEAHDRSARLLALGGWTLAAGLILGMATATQTPELSFHGANGLSGGAVGGAEFRARAKRDAALRHWRRIAVLFEDDPKGPLEAAALLNGAGLPPGAPEPTRQEREAAKHWAAEALARELAGQAASTPPTLGPPPRDV